MLPTETETQPRSLLITVQIGFLIYTSAAQSRRSSTLICNMALSQVVRVRRGATDARGIKMQFICLNDFMMLLPQCNADKKPDRTCRKSHKNTNKEMGKHEQTDSERRVNFFFFRD